MNIYLSCSSHNAFFIETITRVVERMKSIHGTDAITLYYPPHGIPNDSGKVITNVLKIREADLVIFDITPDSVGSGGSALNPGVMIEYGIVVALENQDGIPWGRPLRPTYRVYLSTSVTRSSIVTPILNQESIVHYEMSEEGTERLSEEIAHLVENKMTEMLTFQFRFTNTGVTFQIGQQIGSIKPVYTP